LWFSVHQHTGLGLVRMEWPDGKSLVEQPAITIHMFELLTQEIQKHHEQQRNRTDP
jgi:hypothetical protein